MTIAKHIFDVDHEDQIRSGLVLEKKNPENVAKIDLDEQKLHSIMVVDLLVAVIYSSRMQLLLSFLESFLVYRFTSFEKNCTFLPKCQGVFSPPRFMFIFII